MYILNGEFYENNEKTISPTSQAFMFGYGLFETLKVLDGKILFTEEHLKRLEQGLQDLNLKLDIKNSKIVEDSYKLLERNSMNNGVLKILCAKGWEKNHLVITTRDNPYTQEDYKEGFKLKFSRYKRNQDSLLTFIKSNNYMENIIEKENVLEQGYDEVIFLNTDNNIAEGSSSNIFWIKDKTIYTPSIDCGLLPGIVRDKVAASIENLKLEFIVGRFPKTSLINSDEAFITNSIMDIMPISKIETKLFNLEKNEITKQISKEYSKLMGEEYEKQNI